MHRPHTTVANRAHIYRSLKPQVYNKPGVLQNQGFILEISCTEQQEGNTTVANRAHRLKSLKL